MLPIPRPTRLTSLRYVVLGAAILVALAFADVPVADWVRGHRFTAGTKDVLRLVRLPGTFAFTAVLAALIAWPGRRRWRAAGLLLATGATAGLSSSLLKIACGRHRPSLARRPFDWEAPWARSSAADFLPGNLSFPSGDATLAFATAAVVVRLFPRATVPAYSWACAVAATRVLQGVHYPSDVLAGAFLGFLAAEASLRVGRRWNVHSIPARLNAGSADRVPETTPDNGP